MVALPETCQMCRALNTVSSVRKTEKELGLEARQRLGLQIEKPTLEVTRFHDSLRRHSAHLTWACSQLRTFILA